MDKKSLRDKFLETCDQLSKDPGNQDLVNRAEAMRQQLLLSTSPSQTTNELLTTQDIRDAHENESAPQNSTILDPGQTTTQTEDNRIDHERESGPQNPTIRDHLAESTIFHVRIDPLYLFYLTGKFFNIYPKWIGTDHKKLD